MPTVSISTSTTTVRVLACTVQQCHRNSPSECVEIYQMFATTGGDPGELHDGVKQEIRLNPEAVVTAETAV
jgi:hypothetical protein